MNKLKKWMIEIISMERRRTPRIDMSWMAHLTVQGHEYGCNLKNLNNGGALLVVKDSPQKKIIEKSIGEDAVLTFKYNSKSERSFSGKIVRVDINSRAHKIAIEFVFNH